MFDIPPNLPEPMDPPMEVMEACVSAAANHFRIHPMVIQAIIDVEGGRLGTVSKNTNGTYDLGIMQINTVNLPEIQRAFPSIGWRDIAFKPCIDIGVGTWILSKRIKETDKFWVGVGNYHSKTPRVRRVYLKKIADAYQRRLASTK